MPLLQKAIEHDQMLCVICKNEFDAVITAIIRHNFTKYRVRNSRQDEEQDNTQEDRPDDKVTRDEI